MSVVVPAGKAQIMRASQKDDAVVIIIQQKVVEQIHEIMGNVPGKEGMIIAAKIAAKLVYYGCTTLAGFQTLGEEYSGIVMINSNAFVPSHLALLQMILLKCCGGTLVSYLMRRWDVHLQSATFTTTISPVIQERLKNLNLLIKDVLSYLPIINNGIFYLNGVYHDVAKRLTGISYVLVHFWLHRKDAHPGFKILGIVSLLYSTILMIRTYIKWHHQQYMTIKELPVSSTKSNNSRSRCHFCLELRRDTAITPCGHLFCWKCVMEALLVKPECPVCREKVEPSRVAVLQNYDG